MAVTYPLLEKEELYQTSDINYIYLTHKKLPFCTNMIDNIFNLDYINLESFSKVATLLLSSKVGFSIVVILITVLLLSPVSTSAFRKNLSFGVGKPRRNTKTAFREFGPSLYSVRDESLQSAKKKFESIAVKFEDRKENVKRLLDEFSQPFNVNMRTSDNNFMVPENSEEDEEHTVIVENPNAPKEGIAHFVFFVHGYNGKPADLLYLRTAMASEAEQRLASNVDKSCTVAPNGSHTKEIIFHSCQTNSGQTSDGVKKGGKHDAFILLHFFDASKCEVAHLTAPLYI